MQSEQTTRLQSSSPLSLFTAHMDAWMVTFGISLTAVFVHGRFDLATAALVLAVTVGYWMAFAINDYFDAPFDAADPAKAQRNFFVTNRVSGRALALAFTAIGLMIMPAFAQFGWPGIAVVLISVFVMWEYSAPPLRFKSRPGIDIVVHAIFVQTFPYAATVWLIDTHWLPLDTVLVTLGLMTSLLAQLEQQIRDADLDAKSETTFTLIIGPWRALRILQIGTVFAVGYGIYHVIFATIPPLIAPLGLITVPAALHRLVRKPNQPRPEKMIRLTVIAAGIYLVGLAIYLFFFLGE